MADKTPVDPFDKPVMELKRKIVFKDGSHLNLRNVRDFNPLGTYLRLWSDEGYILIREKSVLYHIITPVKVVA
jgi:hypothetical protein